MRMFGIPDYNKDAEADNIRLFHGREVRKVPNAAGGMNFVLHLSLANGDDPEGRLKTSRLTHSHPAHHPAHHHPPFLAAPLLH